jgi:hypothetical protein
MIDFRLGRHVLGVEVLRSQAVLVVDADVPAGEVTGAAAARRGASEGLGGGGGSSYVEKRATNVSDQQGAAPRGSGR